MSHVADSRKNRLSTLFQGVLPPSGQQILAEKIEPGKIEPPTISPGKDEWPGASSLRHCSRRRDAPRHHDRAVQAGRKTLAPTAYGLAPNIEL